MCVFESEFVHMRMMPAAAQGGAGVTESWEPQDMGARNLTQWS